MVDVRQVYSDEELQELLATWHKILDSREYEISYTLCLDKLAQLGEHLGPLVHELLTRRAGPQVVHVDDAAPTTPIPEG